MLQFAAPIDGWHGEFLLLLNLSENWSGSPPGGLPLQFPNESTDETQLIEPCRAQDQKIRFFSILSLLQ